MRTTTLERDGPILVIEPDGVRCAAIVHAVRDDGFRVAGVTTLEAAWAEILRTAPDLLVFDASTNGARSRQFLAEVAALPNPPRVIVLHDNGASADLGAVFSVPTIYTPFEMATLIDAIAAGGAKVRLREPTGAT